MISARHKAGLVLLLALATIGAATAWRPTQHLADTKPKVELEQIFPQRMGAWELDTRGPVQLVSPDQQALLNRLYNQTLSRTYTNPQGDRVMLSVAYGGDQSDGTRAHRPDVCYPAQGFEILAQTKGAVALPGQQLPVQQMVARQGARLEPVTYWFVVGNRVVLSGSQQKLAQLAYGTRGLIPDGLLMRVSTIDANPAHSYAVQADFLRAMHGAVQPQWRTQVFGADQAAALSQGSPSVGG